MTYDDFLLKLADYRGLFMLLANGAIRLSSKGRDRVQGSQVMVCCPGLVVAGDPTYCTHDLETEFSWARAVVASADNSRGSDHFSFSVRADLLRVLGLES